MTRARRKHRLFCERMVRDLKHQLRGAPGCVRPAIKRAIARWRRVADQWPVVIDSNLWGPSR